jgi:hypothetical protein
MELYRFPRQDTRKFEEVSQSWPSSMKRLSEKLQQDLCGVLKSTEAEKNQRNILPKECEF